MHGFRPLEFGVRNAPLSGVEDLPRAVLAIATDYTPGTVLPRHRHRRAQLLYGMSGLMEVTTDDGAWVIPPYSGVWIPAGQPHQVRMQGVSTRSLYIEPQAAPRAARQCEVLVVSPLLHQLLLAAADVEGLHALGGRDEALMTLILHEVAAAPSMPLSAPIGCDAQLARLCRAFLKAPDRRISAEQWAAQVHRSPRQFSRFFRQQTGMSFARWRQQACLLAALARLSAGESVTSVALELGYASPAAFSALFKQRLGQAPSVFQRQVRGEGQGD